VVLKLDPKGRPVVKSKRKKKKLEKEAENLRRLEFETIFINGKQKRVKRTLTIDGVDVDEFIRRNMDPIDICSKSATNLLISNRWLPWA
jgi:hypothetical protein